MKFVFCFAFFLIPLASLAEISRCNQPTVGITRVWTGGWWGINRDLYGPIGAKSGQCIEIYNRYFDTFGEADCDRMVIAHAQAVGTNEICSQLGFVVDPWDGKADANVCYACEPQR